MDKFCTECGTSVTPGERFCTGCGHALASGGLGQAEAASAEEVEIPAGTGPRLAGSETALSPEEAPGEAPPPPGEEAGPASAPSAR